MAKGSLARVYKPCIRARCKACREGRKHATWIFSVKEEGRRRCLYVPVALVPILRRALRHGRAMERALSRAGAALIRAHRTQRAGAPSSAASTARGSRTSTGGAGR